MTFVLNLAEGGRDLWWFSVILNCYPYMTLVSSRPTTIVHALTKNFLRLYDLLECVCRGVVVREGCRLRWLVGGSTFTHSSLNLSSQRNTPLGC